jgi:phage baseplate assembly protein W
MPGRLGTDIALELVDSRALSIYRVRQRERRVVSAGRAARLRDFATLSDRANLGQALVVRLLTPKGELTALGHPGYGSRLHEVIGAPNTPTTRNLAKLFVIEALKEERRIETIVSVDVEPHPTDRFQILIGAAVKPIGQDTVLPLGPLLLELSGGGP